MLADMARGKAASFVAKMQSTGMSIVVFLSLFECVGKLLGMVNS